MKTTPPASKPAEKHPDVLAALEQLYGRAFDMVECWRPIREQIMTRTGTSTAFDLLEQQLSAARESIAHARAEKGAR